MEKLYEFNILSYRTILYKDYCELYDDDLLGNHQSDLSMLNFLEMTDFDYDKTLLDEESYVENYNNLCSDLMFQRSSLYVQKNEDKISIKFFVYSKTRLAGKKFFKKKTICHFITYNFKQNSLYTGFIQNYHLKRKFKKEFGKNLWYKKPIQTFIKMWVNYIKEMRLNYADKTEQSSKEVNEAMTLFLSNISDVDMSINGYDNIIYKRYLDYTGVKVPNNWIYFKKSFPQITKKIFKKYNFKFVDAFMGLNDLYGDKVKRVLHNVTSTDGVESLKFGIKFFGQDFILSQPDQFIKELIESSTLINWEDYLNQLQLNLNDFTKTEVKYCFQIFKLVIRGEINFNSFVDHLTYKTRLKNYNPVMWKSKDYGSFSEEHYIWSEKISEINNTQYNRFYYEPFKKYIETPIDEYYPILLSDHKEYVTESFDQSNCVRTYTDKPDSMIISIRKGCNTSRDRSTIEYKIKKYDENLVIKRVQSLGRFNNKLDPTWDEVLKTLDDRINNSLTTNLFELPKVEIKRGGKSCISNIIFLGGEGKITSWSEFLNEKKISQIAVFDKHLTNHSSDNIIDMFI